MIETKPYLAPISLVTRRLPDVHDELSRLLAAAVINPEFCHLLLDNPELALKSGFQGEDFQFTKEARELILSTRADSLADLANQFMWTFSEHLPVFIDHPVQAAPVFGY